MEETNQSISQIGSTFIVKEMTRPPMNLHKIEHQRYKDQWICLGPFGTQDYLPTSLFLLIDDCFYYLYQ